MYAMCLWPVSAMRGPNSPLRRATCSAITPKVTHTHLDCRRIETAFGGKYPISLAWGGGPRRAFANLAEKSRSALLANVRVAFWPASSKFTQRSSGCAVEFMYYRGGHCSDLRSSPWWRSLEYRELLPSVLFDLK